MDPDLEVLNDVAAGREPALNELMLRYKEPLNRFAYRYLLNVSDAAEVVQETFVRVWFNAHRFKPSAKVANWIFSIAANLCRDRSRRSRRWRLLPLEQPVGAAGRPLSESLTGDEDAVPSAFSVQDDLDRVRAHIDTLPYKLKAPFILCVLEDRSQEEAAAILGISTKAVETRIYRVRNRLRREFDRA